MFLWRASNEALPTKLNLHKRKVVESPLCLICLVNPKFVSHIVWSCSSVQDIWGLSSRRIQKCRIEESSFREILDHLFFYITDEELAEIAMKTQHIWKRRNTWVFEAKFTPHQQLVNQSTQLLIGFRYGSQVVPKKAGSNSMIVDKWTTPPINYYKINWDAAIDKIQCKVGIRVVIRNWDGRVIATLRSTRAIFLILSWVKLLLP